MYHHRHNVLSRLDTPMLFFLLPMLLLLVLTTRSALGYFNSGSSRELSRVPFVASNSSTSYGVFRDQTYVLPAGSAGSRSKVIYSFHTHSELRGHYSTWTFDDIWTSTDTLYAGCFDPIHQDLYLLVNHVDVYRILRDNVVELLYSFDSPVSVYNFFCFSAETLVVVTDYGFLYVNASSNTKQLRVPQQLVVNSVLAAGIAADHLVVSFPSYFSMSAQNISVFSYALNDSFSLVQSVDIPLENNTQLLSCAISSSFANGSQIDFLLRSASDTTLQTVTVDTRNLSFYRFQNSNISNPWSTADAHNFFCVSFVEENVAFVTLRIPNMDDKFVRVNTTTALAEMDLYELPVTLRGLKLGFSSAERFQIVGCEMDADVEICRLFQYEVITIRNGGGNCNATLVDSINVATQPYDIQATAFESGPTAAVFALSIPQSARSTSANSEIYFELLKLDLSDFHKPTLRSSVTFQVPLCRESSPLYTTLTTNLELELDGSLMLQVNCRSLFFDTRSLRLLSRPVITEPNCTAQIPQNVPTATDRNGTQFYIWRDIRSGALVAEETYYRNGTCSEQFFIVNRLLPQVAVSNAAMEIWMGRDSGAIGIISPFFYASFTAKTIGEWNLTYMWMNDTLSQSIDAYLTVPVQYEEMIYYVNVAFGSNGNDVDYDIYFSSMNSSSNQFDALLLQWFSLPLPPQSITFFSVTNSSLQVLFDYGLLVTALLPSGEITDTIRLSPANGPYVCAIPSSASTHAVVGGIYLVSGANMYLVYSNCDIGQYRNVSSGECLSCPSNSISSLEDQQLCLSCPPRTTVDPESSLCLCSPNYYSANNDTNCTDCPAGALCVGNNTIIAQNGYWRGNDSFYSCPFASGCEPNGCAPGYRGVVCGVCASGYGRTPAGCGVCPRVPWHYSFPILSVTLFVLLVILILLWRDTKGDNEQFFGIVKTVLSFAQVLSFPSGRVPYFANRTLETLFTRIVSLVNTIGLRVFSAASLDCLVGRDVPSFYVELLSIGFVPLAIGLLILAWCQLCRSPLEPESPADSFVTVAPPAEGRQKEMYHPEDRVANSIDRSGHFVTDTKLGAPIRLLLFIFLLLYPYVSSMIVQFFDCQQVDGRYYLVADYSSVCFSGTWRKMLLYEAILAILYPIGGPVAVFLPLKYKRHSVNVMFMTARYKPKYYYWDVVEMLRKFALLCSLVWDQYEQQKNPSGWFSGLPLLVASFGLLLHVHIRPHSARLDYYLHAMSLLGVCLLYGLPAITPTDHRNLYRVIASYVVIIYIAGFTVLSSLIAVYVARHQLWKLAVSVVGKCCCYCYPRRNETRGERQHLLLKSV